MNHPTRGGRAVAAEPNGEARPAALLPHHVQQGRRRGVPFRARAGGWRRPGALLLLATLLAVLVTAGAGCGASATAGGGEPADPREITVFAAASLTEAFTQIAADFTAAEPQVKVVFSFAGSNDLVTQIRQGAPADVLATADTGAMDDAGDLITDPQPFAANKLIIAVAPGNPLGVTGLGDLSRDDVKVVLAAPEVPAGKYADEILSRAGVEVEPVSLEVTVKGVVTKVALGEADAGIVYVTDVTAAEGDIDGVTIADDENVVAVYPLGVVTASARPDDAAAFVDFVLSADGQKVLADHGFLPAP
jgi:molybdate transport system substrate-binding protein